MNILSIPPPTMTTPDLEQLKAECVCQKSASAWFCTKADPRWAFSNMAGGMPLFFPMPRAPQNEWCASEQLYQATRYGATIQCLPAANLQAGPCVRNRIRQSKNPRAAKMTQKCAVAAGLVRPDWEHPEQEVRIQTMLWVLELKFYWNPYTFGGTLRETGDLPIVEISTKDAFGGRKAEGDELRGCNVLGKLLMNVRARSATVRRGQFTHPKGWHLP